MRTESGISSARPTQCPTRPQWPHGPVLWTSIAQSFKRISYIAFTRTCPSNVKATIFSAVWEVATVVEIDSGNSSVANCPVTLPQIVSWPDIKTTGLKSWTSTERTAWLRELSAMYYICTGTVLCKFSITIHTTNDTRFPLSFYSGKLCVSYHKWSPFQVLSLWLPYLLRGRRTWMKPDRILWKSTRVKLSR